MLRRSMERRKGAVHRDSDAAFVPPSSEPRRFIRLTEADLRQMPASVHRLALFARTDYTLNHMVQYSSPVLDLSFAALADATRRGIIDQLGRGDASITGLADAFQMTLTGMKKHVQVLERAGLIVTQKVGRVRTCKLGQRGLKAEAEWIEARCKFFEARFEALDEIISELKQEDGDESAK
jgi:DNA-binding transcriptional ArsR family regulator